MCTRQLKSCRKSQDPVGLEQHTGRDSHLSKLMLPDLNHYVKYTHKYFISIHHFNVCNCNKLWAITTVQVTIGVGFSYYMNIVYK